MGAREAAVKRGWAIRRAGFWNPESAADVVVLDAGDRHRRRIKLAGERGTEFLLDLDEAVALRDGDGIMLDDGGIVLVTGQREPLAEIAARTPLEFVRLAWHLGNRHTDVQIAGLRLRIRRDHVLEEMVAGLGASVTAIDASFDPEANVQASAPPVHDHGHDHGR
ncbi:MAG: urease accessory protein UreE [Xanthobacteraceae bacterium]|nr:urease accessory protein UreE [Xanthobacteraceae bacterium]